MSAPGAFHRGDSQETLVPSDNEEQELDVDRLVIDLRELTRDQLGPRFTVKSMQGEIDSERVLHVNLQVTFSM